MRTFTTTAATTLLIACFLASAELRANGTTKTGTDSTQAIFDQVAKMKPTEQQAWLLQLEKRAKQAAEKALLPSDAARQQARIAAMLHQQLVTWRTLREVVEETDLLEKETAKLQAEEKRQREAVKPQAVVKHEERKEEHKNVAKPQTDAKHDEVEVNVEELKARVAGSNLGFRTLESELDEKDAWDAASLTPLMDRLKVLVSRHDDLALYCDLTPKAQRSSVGRLEAPQGVISQLAAKISEARKQASGDEFSGSATERQAELDRLESLSRRLAELERK